MKAPLPLCNLERCFLCRHSLPGWINAIAANRTHLKFRKGQMICTEGDPVTGVYFLYDGVVKVHKRWTEGKELIINFARAGDIVGYRGLGAEKVYPVSITALQPCTFCFIDLAFFESTLQVNYPLTYAMMELYANELQDAEKRMRNLALMDVKGRLADTLLSLHRKFGEAKGGYIDLLLSRQDMASYTGTTYETLFRMLMELAHEKVVAVNGKKISIKKPARLRALSTLQ